MMSAAVSLPGVLKIASMSAQIFFVYRLNLAMQLLGVLLQVYLLKVVWTAVYAGREEVDGIALGTLVGYLTLANLQVWGVFPEIAEFLPRRIREGSIALDLARPVGLIPQLIWQNVGLTAGTLAFVVAALPLAAVLGSLQAPASPEAGLLYVVSSLLSYGVVLGLGLVIGLISFWTVETQGFVLIYLFVSQFFSGALVPLWFFPDWLRTIAELLPFQTIAFLPLSIYVGTLAGMDALRALGVAILWIVLLWSIAWLLWRQAIRRVVVHGG